MISGELGACPRQVGHTASVPGEDHPCGRVYFDAGGGCGRAYLCRGVDRSKMYELSFSWTSLWLQFCHCFGVSWCELDVCETPWSGKVTEHLWCTLWAFVRPEYGRNTCAAEWLSDHLGEVGLWCRGPSGSYQANQSSNPSGLGNPEQRKSRSRQLLPRLVGLASIWI